MQKEAVSHIKDGYKVVTSFGCCEPIGVERAMTENFEQFHNVTIYNMLLLRETPWVEEKYKGHFKYNSFFCFGF